MRQPISQPARAIAAVALIAITFAAVAAAGSGNYLIVTANDYNHSTPLDQFIAAKTAQGFAVETYVAASGESNVTIQNYVKSRWLTTDPPDYLLIVGDTDGSTAGSNTIPHWVGHASRNATTDLYYACMDGGDDWHPEFPVGRFSVRTIAQLQNVVDKTLFVEAGSFPDPYYVSRAAFLATNDMSSGAEETHDWVIENFMDPADFTSNKIYARLGGGTSDITNAVNNGTLFCVYFGHSGSSGWSTPSYSQSNVSALSNDGLYGLVMGWSCNTAHYSYDECFGETWLREPHKGAAAYLSASDYIFWGDWEAWEPSRQLERYFFTSIFGDNIWEVGPAWLSALQYFEGDFGSQPGNGDITRNFFELMVLLGDPSLRLPQLTGFHLDPQPEQLDLCAPDDAVYTITVDQIAGYTETITLSASGAPAGTQVTFSENSQQAPFTSVMTISNTAAADSGHYPIQITGTATDMERSATVTLNLSNAVPGVVTLTSPADGQTDVSRVPTLTWDAATQAFSYDVEIATDAGFSDIVYSATTTDTSHDVDGMLDVNTQYYWHVRALNGCGDSGFCDAFTFSTPNMILPIAYDMLNGESGTYTYHDDAYNGDGDNTVDLAPLSNGVGDLTDGVIATQNWNSTSEPYVGWVSEDPTITFHFDGVVNISVVTLYFDDSNGAGGVYPPSDVQIVMGGTTLNLSVDDPAGGEPFAVTYADLGLSGDTLELTLADYRPSQYFMISEVEFYGDDQCPGDVDGDGDVDLNDLSTLLAHYGMTGGAQYEDGDLDGDGDVDLNDLSALLALYGTNC